MKLKDVKVEEFTTPNPTCVSEGTTLGVVLDLMISQNIRHVLVLNPDDQVVGLISERDILSYKQSTQFAEVTASQVMAKDLLTVSPERRLYEVAFEMSKNKFGSAVVCDKESQFLGIFTATDALNAIVELLRGDFGS